MRIALDEQKLLDRALRGDLTPQEVGQAINSFRGLLEEVFRDKSLQPVAKSKLHKKTDTSEAVQDVLVEATKLAWWAIGDLPIHRCLLTNRLNGQRIRIDAELAEFVSLMADPARLEEYRHEFETHRCEVNEVVKPVLEALRGTGEGEFVKALDDGDLLRGMVATVCCDARRWSKEPLLGKETRAVLRQLDVPSKQLTKFLPDPGVPTISWLRLLVDSVVKRLNRDNQQSRRNIPVEHDSDEDVGGNADALLSEARPVERPDEALAFRELLRAVERYARHSKDPRGGFLLIVEAGWGPVVRDREDFRQTLLALAEECGLSPKDLRLVRHRIGRLRKLLLDAPLQLDIEQLATLFDVKPATIQRSIASSRRQLQASLASD